MAGAISRKQSEQKKDRVIELIRKGLASDVIGKRVGLRTERVNKIRKEVENTPDRGS